MRKEVRILQYRRPTPPLSQNGLSSQLARAVKDRPEILAGDQVMTTALLDRLPHQNHVLNSRGRSYRLRQLEKVLK